MRTPIDWFCTNKPPHSQFITLTFPQAVLLDDVWFNAFRSRSTPTYYIPAYVDIEMDGESRLIFAKNHADKVGFFLLEDIC